MKRNNKKGFTIVELTIVIAVIAILAAVLIPTFSSVVDKANQSADVQLIRQANVVLQAATADGSSLSEDQAKQELKNNSITLGEPSNSDNVFYYSEDEKRYVIWSKTDKKVIFPDGSDYLPSFQLTYDWNLGENGVGFAQEEYIDTGYLLDFDNDFTITETIQVDSENINERFLLIGCYMGQGEDHVLNIEINGADKHDGSLRINTTWYRTYSSAEEKGVICANEDIVITFKWDSAKKEYTATAKGNTTNITMTGYIDQMSGKSSAAMRIGKDRRTGTSPFNPITVKSLQITTQYRYGDAVTNPSDPSGNAEGYTSGKWENPVSTMPAENTTITAKWGE